jgi:hypothetical protein
MPSQGSASCEDTGYQRGEGGAVSGKRVDIDEVVAICACLFNVTRNLFIRGQMGAVPSVHTRTTVVTSTAQMAIPTHFTSTKRLESA